MAALYREILAYANNIKPTDFDQFRTEEGAKKICFYENIDLIMQEVLSSFALHSPISDVIGVVKKSVDANSQLRPSARIILQEFNKYMPTWPTFQKYDCCHCGKTTADTLRDASLASLMNKFRAMELQGTEMEEVVLENDENMAIDLEEMPSVRRLRRRGPFAKGANR